MSHPGNPKSKPESLAIAYSVKRKGKRKAAGGSVSSGSKDMNYADGGEVSASNEKRPMPDSKYHDSAEASRNSAKKAITQSQWTDQPTLPQARKGPRTTPIKHPKMVPQSTYSVRLRDQEDDLLSSASPGHPGSQPARWMDEEEAAKQGKSMPQAYAKGGGVMDHDVAPSEDEGRSLAHALDELRPDRKGPSVPDEEHDSSIADAIMSKRRAAKVNPDSGSEDLEDAAMYALGGEILDDSADEISSHDSIYSDDSDQADLSRNADEDANEEDQLSFDALRKENYSESEGLRKLSQPKNSNLKSDSEEMDSQDAYDTVDSIRRRMKSR